MADLQDLQKIINIKFSNSALLEQAVTHKSYLNEQSNPDLQSYERLEFLGDSILGEIIAESLYIKFPQTLEGDLTKMRSSLVSGQSLFKIGQELGIEQFIITGKGEGLSNSAKKRSVVAAIFESITAAIYLDQGFDTAKEFILKTFESRLSAITPRDVHKSDPKSDLQEYTQRAFQQLPKYHIISQSGPDHEPTFEISVQIKSDIIASATGRSKSEAETKVASLALRKLNSKLSES
ncbi:MAG: Ribonuclease 3 [Chloroflexota bacterium]|nr:ribonuclease III [Dehalococcoidia bacterium]MQG59845.1 ribonuclease III [SAR202 cluster bacterium]CAI8359612.1 MAG: Ribonuclease 3 [Chloroflexota bacterium]